MAVAIEALSGVVSVDMVAHTVVVVYLESLVSRDVLRAARSLRVDAA